jgi:cell wall-associated NlpC family hydrolase
MTPTETLVAGAIDWAIEHLDDPSYALRCLAFVEDAFERPNGIEVFGKASAAECAASFDLEAYDASQPPPTGALVFYACSGPIDGQVGDWGHVGLALGDGRVIHAWDVVRVDDARDVGGLRSAAGWSAPRLVGWAPADRLLQGHRPRAWDEG